MAMWTKGKVHSCGLRAVDFNFPALRPINDQISSNLEMTDCCIILGMRCKDCSIVSKSGEECGRSNWNIRGVEEIEEGSQHTPLQNSCTDRGDSRSCSAKCNLE